MRLEINPYLPTCSLRRAASPEFCLPLWIFSASSKLRATTKSTMKQMTRPECTGSDLNRNLRTAQVEHYETTIRLLNGIALQSLGVSSY